MLLLSKILLNYDHVVPILILLKRNAAILRVVAMASAVVTVPVPLTAIVASKIMAMASTLMTPEIVTVIFVTLAAIVTSKIVTVTSMTLAAIVTPEIVTPTI
jgi:hypothetical protein